MTRGRLALFAALLFVSYAYFYPAGGWNQNSRFALVRAIVERHSLSIDPYYQDTGDRALWNGHYYSDKAPGLSLAAVPAAALASAIAHVAGVDPVSRGGLSWISYAATVATAGAFTILAALCIWRVTRRWGASEEAAFFAASAYAIASPAWCYATLFMGHNMTAGCLMLAFTAALECGEPETLPDRRRRLAWTIGIAAGWAVVTEFPAAVPAAVIIFWVVADVSRHRSAEVAPVATALVAGSAIAGVVLLAYNAAAFGSPLHLGYASEEGFEQLHTGIFGITYPTFERMREILVGSYRGLLPLAPLFAVTPIGLVELARAHGRQRAVSVAGIIAVFYFLLNASYFYWEGGWSYGPRHVMPALPFLALGLAPLWDWGGRAGRFVLASAWVWGAALTFVAISTTPQPPGGMMSPVTELLWPAFRDGDLSLNHQGFADFRANPDLLRGHQVPHAAWNLGEILGLHGKTSLLPLLAVWIVIALVWLALRRDQGERERTPVNSSRAS